MEEDKFLSTLESLSGKVAIVTGGSQGIGLQTTILLTRLGATIYVCSLDGPHDQAGLAFAQDAASKSKTGSTVHFHPLDLSSVQSAKDSAEVLKKKLLGHEKRLDILIGNAGTAFTTQDILSPDGVERTFAVNCLGHFAFITSLLDLIEKTATEYGDSRITLTSSYGYKSAKKLDYEALTTRIPDDGKRLKDLSSGMQKYYDSKLAVLYFALELDRRLQERGVQGVRVNACHPGNCPNTRIGRGNRSNVPPVLEDAIKKSLTVWMRHKPIDAAKTQVFLSASKRVGEEKVRGEFWAPQWNWKQKFVGCGREELEGKLAGDRAEWEELWKFCEERVERFEKGVVE